MNGWYLRLLAIGASALILGCRTRTREESEAAVKPLVSVRLATIERGPGEQTVSIPGKTGVARRERIVSPIAGRIVTMDGFPGARVKQGEALARIRTRESDAAITGAQEFMQQASTAELRAEAGRMLELAESTQRSVALTASFDGVIVARNADVNETVAENTVIYEIVDPSTMNFTGEAPLAAAVKLRPGQHATVRFDALPDSAFPVKVENVGAEADSQTQTVRVLMKFRSGPASLVSLKTDMQGVAAIVVGTHADALLVPQKALLRNDVTDTYSVVTITSDSLSKTVDVTVGPSSDSLVEISGAGLAAGMAVITRGNFGLADSTRITTGMREKP